MFTLASTVSALRQCEAIITLSMLDENDRRELLEAVLQGFPDPDYSAYPAATERARDAVRRLLASCGDKSPGRQAEGVEEPAPVAGRSASERAASEGTGTPEGVQEQTQDAGGIRRQKPGVRRKAAPAP